MKKQRWLLIALFLIGVAAFIAYGFVPRGVLVETVLVSRGPLTVSIEAEGKTRIKNRYVISAPVAGIARRIVFDVGDPVRRGQIVAWLAPLRPQVLDPRSRAQAQARLAAAEAALQAAKANEQATVAATDYTGAELDRLRRLRKTGVVSQDVLDQAESESRRIEAQRRSAASAVEVARYQLEAARSELRYSAAREAGEADAMEQVTLTAPADGQVLKIYQRSEYVVGPGQALLEIGDPRDLEVEIDVLSADAVRIVPGSEVLFERWGEDWPLEGRVRVVEPVAFTKISALGVEEQRVLVIADIVVPPERWRRLGDGYRVEARFILWQGERVLQIPTSALIRHRDGWAVFTLDNSRARLQAVEPGRRSGLIAEISAGLAAGDSVIVYPDDALENGSRVRVHH